MPALVQIFSCPRCNRGEFRSLPGLDGTAFCPWCGSLVAGGAAAPPTPVPAAAPAAPPSNADGERIAELTRNLERVESELRRELDKKQGIKNAVLQEMAQFERQLSEAKELLRRKDEERLAAQAEAGGLADLLAQERRKIEGLTASKGSLEEKEKAVVRLQGELDESRKTLSGQQASRDAALREAEQARTALAKAKASSDAEIAELRKKLAASESRVGVLRIAGDELTALKTRSEEYRKRSEKERAELQEKATTLQGEVEKRDQRVRDLQLLVKTLGERLNDLTSRRYG